jgi:hypothetical protein
MSNLGAACRDDQKLRAVLHQDTGATFRSRQVSTQNYQISVGYTDGFF